MENHTPAGRPRDQEHLNRTASHSTASSGRLVTRPICIASSPHDFRNACVLKQVVVDSIGAIEPYAEMTVPRHNSVRLAHPM
jgi:hypothetical protein